jgi:hypothetical protein
MSTATTAWSDRVRTALDAQPIVDVHTHVYPPAFGTPTANPSLHVDPRGLMLWGIDEVLTYHYLVAEVFRVLPPREITPETFFAMPKAEQADLIWEHLFVRRSPVSEACRGVLTVLQRFGLDPGERDLKRYRRWFAERDPDEHIDSIMELANVASITMTNAVFDDEERQRWLADPTVGDDPRFEAVLRFDPLLRNWPEAGRRLSEWGYEVREDLDERTVGEVRRFLREWLDRTGGIYCAVSLPPQFVYPAEAGDVGARAGQAVLERAVLPVCAERGLPFAMMIGSTDHVNPALRDAGQMSGKTDVGSLARLCHGFPANRFLVTLLSRENQHELAVCARKFQNLMVFGCWWFLNNPSLVEEITRLRVELLGTSFVPQHSDARVLEQLVYKWDHSRAVIARVLADKYADLEATGWRVSDEELRRDVDHLCAGNFRAFLEA